MEKNSKVIIDKYKEDSNILEWNLEEMKNQLDKMDIYIIDKELKVIASSIQEEVGLDLNILPEFSKLLKQRLVGDKFESDAINFSLLNGELKKYSYMPTPDNKYLIELSITIKEIYPELEDLNIVYLSNDLKDKYPFVEDIKVWKFNKDKEYSHDLDTSKKKPSKYMKFKQHQDKYVKVALETNQVQEQIVKDDDNNTYTLRYIPYIIYHEKNRLTWWNSYVIEVVYNDQIMIEDISYQRKLFLQSMVIISVSYFLFAFIIIYLIQKKQEMAYNDHLTKLPNRKRFEEVMEYKMVQANRRNTKVAILFFDLDKFKKINDTFGHNVGDKVLQEVANRINSKMRKGDIVSRLGGDEFTALICGINSQEEIVEIVKMMSDLFDIPMNIDSQEIFIRPSIGISIYPDHGNTTEQLISKADDAMYKAKEQQVRYKTYEEIGHRIRG